MDTVRPYHHGDLRRHLVEAARAEVDEFGAEGVVLTRLASTCGVSVAAPYRHFVNRDALLAAVAAEGFVELGEALREHAHTGSTPATGSSTPGWPTSGTRWPTRSCSG